MKTPQTWKALLLLAFVIPMALVSCNDDDEKKPDVLVVSHRTNGKFYSVDKTTGTLTEIFTLTLGSGTLNEIRGFVYHRGQDKFYISQSTAAGGNTPILGHLYSANPRTRVATMINRNDGKINETDATTSHAVWDAIVNWVVAPDDSLIAVGDFNEDDNGIVKFGTNGGRSRKTAVSDICCGMGLLMEGNKLLVGNGWNTNDLEIVIDRVALNGTIEQSTQFKEAAGQTGVVFVGFPDNLTTEWLTLKAMAKDKDGTIYGLVYPDGIKKTYFCKIDMTAKKITWISTIGANGSEQYNTLAFIPEGYARPQ